jgi:hypothetical protein
MPSGDRHPFGEAMQESSCAGKVLDILDGGLHAVSSSGKAGVVEGVFEGLGGGWVGGLARRCRLLLIFMVLVEISPQAPMGSGVLGMSGLQPV